MLVSDKFVAPLALSLRASRGCAPVWGDGNRVPVRLGRRLTAGGWRLAAGGAECALTAPSVRWRRRVCADGAECALTAPSVR
ncbi:hypothetical protein MGAST_21895 [Mycobacterium gastri 'Wayne']|uniref:Uncharacterized protein n=1 Tax=Mycobacterium gastri TaxID=1777 RepID=A0A1X1VGA3_MYCGS|nr:hypothetical protein MGAST_21895 [Mycobacterium gastri 'Wayne']ORV68125.1 hypothetical protein AWC07_08715 [Mycobacterium gastri]